MEKLEFPLFMYIKGGKHHCPGGTFGFAKVETFDELLNYWKLGYRGTIYEAMEAEENDNPEKFISMIEGCDKEVPKTLESKNYTGEPSDRQRSKPPNTKNKTKNSNKTKP